MIMLFFHHGITRSNTVKARFELFVRSTLYAQRFFIVLGVVIRIFILYALRSTLYALRSTLFHTSPLRLRKAFISGSLPRNFR
jgi:hypothetical protein